MNYEALGRYIEASEKLEKLIRQREAHASSLRDAGQRVFEALQNQKTCGMPFEFEKYQDRIDLALNGIKDTTEQIKLVASVINTYADECGKPKSNIA